jgi:hypothetical protein
LKTKIKQQENMKRILSKTQILQVAKSSWPQKNQNVQMDSPEDI